MREIEILKKDPEKAAAADLSGGIVRLARESGLAVNAESDLAELLKELARGTPINVPVLLALSELLGPVFRHERLLRDMAETRPDIPLAPIE